MKHTDSIIYRDRHVHVRQLLPRNVSTFLCEVLLPDGSDQGQLLLVHYINGVGKVALEEASVIPHQVAYHMHTGNLPGK